jgi:hypothetical protein
MLAPGGICPQCSRGKEVCRNCGKKIWSAEADPLCPSCKMAGEKDKPAEEAEHCGWCGAELPPGASICPQCNKGKEVCRNCGKRIWSAEADPLCPACKMTGVKDKSAEKEAEHCGWCGTELAPGASICTKCNKGKEVCRNCGKKIWSAEPNPICPACSMAATKPATPPAPKDDPDKGSNTDDGDDTDDDHDGDN